MSKYISCFDNRKWIKLHVYRFVKSLPNDKILTQSKFKEAADDKIIVTQGLKFVFWNNRKHCGKRRKCWSPAFSPLPAMFSKAFFSIGVKSQDCVVMS